MNKYFTFLGPIAAGKGTQAKLVAQKYGFTHISTGEGFRDEVARGTEVGRLIENDMASGLLIADDITNELLKRLLAKIDIKKGFILDGYPRNRAQAEFLDQLLPAMGVKLDRAVLLHLEEAEIVRRISGRFACTNCGAVYNEFSNSTKVAGVCDKCGGREFGRRADDREELVKVRLGQYRDAIGPILDYYRPRGLLSEIDASAGDMAATLREIEKVVENG